MNIEARTQGVSGRKLERLVRKFDRRLERSGDAVVDRFGEEAAAVMRAEMLDEYRRLIFEVSDIGGRRSIFSDHPAAAPRVMAIYRVAVRHGDRCDLRISKHGVTSAPWPLEFVERTCGEPETKKEKSMP